MKLSLCKARKKIFPVSIRTQFVGILFADKGLTLPTNIVAGSGFSSGEGKEGAGCHAFSRRSNGWRDGSRIPASVRCILHDGRARRQGEVGASGREGQTRERGEAGT